MDFSFLRFWLGVTEILALKGFGNSIVPDLNCFRISVLIRFPSILGHLIFGITSMPEKNKSVILNEALRKMNHNRFSF
jgi:hypothetical protein